MTDFEGAGESTSEASAEPAPMPGPAAAPMPGPAAAPMPGPAAAPMPGPAAAPGSPVAAALAELDTLPGRDLAEHAETYQRIHGELQSALATIDNA